jgi:Xaa-Pro aminopeptidase
MAESIWHRLLRDALHPALLVTSSANLRYLTGMDAHDCVLLVTPKRRILFASPLDAERLRAEIFPGIVVKDLSTITSVLESIPVCHCEWGDVSLERIQRWKTNFKNTKFVRFSDRIEELRRKKSPEELQKFRRAQSLTKSLVAMVPSLLKPGVTEQQVAWVLEKTARERGAEGMSFPPIVGFGTHTSRPHHRPTDRKLSKRAIVQIDIGAQVHGYCGDRSAVFFVGDPTAEQAKVVAAVTKAFRKAKAAVRAGIGTRTLDAIARDSLASAGLAKYFIHSLGHGVGLEVHERPTLSPRAPDIPLIAGEIVTIEPGVYIPDRFGVRIEEEVIVE